MVLINCISKSQRFLFEEFDEFFCRKYSRDLISVWGFKRFSPPLCSYPPGIYQFKGKISVLYFRWQDASRDCVNGQPGQNKHIPLWKHLFLERVGLLFLKTYFCGNSFGHILAQSLCHCLCVCFKMLLPPKENSTVLAELVMNGTYITFLKEMLKTHVTTSCTEQGIINRKISLKSLTSLFKRKQINVSSGC